MDILKAVFLAFLPIAGLTHLIAYYSYRNGIVSIHDDKQGDWDITGAKDWDGIGADNHHDGSQEKERPTNNYLHKKWVSFGGGFYGLMAFLTFSVIEVREVFGFIQRIEGWHTITDMLNWNSLKDLFIESIMNMVDAFIWFNYWPDNIEIGNGWVWLGMAYGGYHIGRWFAELRL
tara:strand:- start:66455 stop:66979 length:525 start_codon:yes stop_codon:yes gene_type:complete